ncbi:hypothetical protein IIA79_01155 [bacterium]|nr:hypothetical protein [bacterium]
MFLVFLLLAVLSSTSCRGPESEHLSVLDLPDPAPAISGLPTLAELPMPERELSLLGPGWFDIDLGGSISSINANDGPAGALELDASGAMAYALYGVFGFDGDNGPTSARLTVDSTAGEFYVGFSDYENGRWTHSGPFTGTVEAEIPDTGDYVSPNAFVSQFKACYIAVIVPEGSAITISSLELGVHGGVLGPQAPADFDSSSNGSVIELSWLASASEKDPDFAGYLLTRAPAFFGEYEPIGGTLTGLYYLDGDVEDGESYRYRLQAVDVSGNSSVHRVIIATGLDPGGMADPIAVLDLPHGPLFGPVDVTLDMSQSFDPEGGVINTYEVSTPGLGTLSGSVDNHAVTLQPGCYVFSAKVHVGLRTGETKRILKVFPQWEDNPVTAFVSAGNLPRLKFVRSGVLPGGKKVHIGFDESIPALAVWSGQGGDFSFFPLPVFFNWDYPTYLGEPVQTGNGLSVPLVAGDDYALYFYDDIDGQFLPIFGATGLPSGIAAAVNLGGNTIGVVFFREDGGLTQLVFLQLSQGGTIEVIVPNITNIPPTGLDAVYHPGTDAIDIVYADSIETHWIRYKPGGGIVDSATLTPFSLLSVDMELDPATGRPVMLHYWDVAPVRARYSALDENDAWTIAQPIDTSDVSIPPGDLVVNESGTFVFNGLDNGGNPVYNLYELDGGLWTVRNTATVAYAPGANTALLVDASSGDALVTGRDANGDTYSEALPSGGGASVEWTLDGVLGQGREMHGAAGADGLHLIYRNIDPGLATHLHSPSAGPWIYQGNPFGSATDLDLGSTSLGEVYASFIDVNSVELHYWDGGMWIQQQAYPGLAGYRPSLSDQPYTELINWVPYLQVANVLRFVQGNQATPFTYNAVMPEESPIWDGTVNNAGYSFSGYSELLALAGGSSPTASDLGFFGLNSPQFTLKIDSVALAGNNVTWGRILDSCVYDSHPGTVRSYWVVYGSALDSIILEEGTSTLDNIVRIGHGITFEDYLLTDLRRTVSMGYTWGGAALALECDLFAEDPLFYWSNYGDWEELPLPSGLAFDEDGHMSMPELIIGTDGRWHIAYHDYMTDHIMVRSTL